MMENLSQPFPGSPFSPPRFSSWPRTWLCRPQKHRPFLRIGIALLAGGPAIVSADPITLVADFRRAAAFAGPVQMERFSADVLTATASSSGVFATATAIGDISVLNHMSGVGSASVESSSAADFFAAAGASFVAAFRLDAPHDYRFSGTGTGPGAAVLTSYSGIGVGQRYFLHFFDGSRFENSRFLDTGSYLLEVAIGTGANSWSPGDRLSSSYGFTFDLQEAVLPEPGSILLLGSGLVALVVRRRIRNRL
jgi:hypothetical protein